MSIILPRSALWPRAISEGADNGNGKKWTPDLNRYFKDRDVYILPDNDAPGRQHAADGIFRAAALLASHARSWGAHASAGAFG